MKKVILNKCYGGFDVSKEAYELYANKKGLTLYQYESELISSEKKFAYKRATKESLFNHYFTKDFKDYLELDKIIKSKDEEIKNLQGSLQTYEIILRTNLESYTEENYKQKKIINHLSRKIQNKNKKYRQLQARKMPPTLYGNKVIIVPDSMADKIMVTNKEFFDIVLKEDK